MLLPHRMQVVRKKSLGEAVTTRNKTRKLNISSSRIERVLLGTSLQFAIANQEEFPIYINILAIYAEEKIIVIFPDHWTDLARQNKISRGAMTLTQPIEVIEDMILDFNSTTRNLELTTKPKTNYLIDTRQLAILSIPFEVIL